MTATTCDIAVMSAWRDPPGIRRRIAAEAALWQPMLGMAGATITDPTKQPFVAFRERKDCSQLFILYCGWAGRVVLPPMELVQSGGIIDRNILMLRDRMRTCYHRGVGGELPDIPSLIAWQKGQLARWTHIRHVYCIGSSGGAQMAMIAGHLLKAEKVWAFAPPVPLTVAGDLTWVDPNFSDLSKVLAEGNGVTQYHVYYNKSHDPDRVGCLKLEGTPGVQLFAEDGEGHPVITHLAHTGRLRDLLPPFEAS